METFIDTGVLVSSNAREPGEEPHPDTLAGVSSYGTKGVSDCGCSPRFDRVQPMNESKPDTETVYCDDCNAAVRLERQDPAGGLVVRCACDDRRSIRVATALPGGWSDE